MQFVEYAHKIPRGYVYKWATQLAKELDLTRSTVLSWIYAGKPILYCYWKTIVQFSKKDKLVKGIITLRDLD